LGINAVVLGPIKIGDNVQISPCAVTSNDIPDNHLLITIHPRAINSKPKQKIDLTIFFKTEIHFKN